MKMFEGIISNNKEKINLPPLPLGCIAHGKNYYIEFH